MLLQRIQLQFGESGSHILFISFFSGLGKEWPEVVALRAWGWEQMKVKVYGVKGKADYTLGAKASDW